MSSKKGTLRPKLEITTVTDMTVLDVKTNLQMKYEAQMNHQLDFIAISNNCKFYLFIDSICQTISVFEICFDDTKPKNDLNGKACF